MHMLEECSNRRMHVLREISTGTYLMSAPTGMMWWRRGVVPPRMSRRDKHAEHNLLKYLKIAHQYPSATSERRNLRGELEITIYWTVTLAFATLHRRPVTSANCQSAILYLASAAAVRPCLRSGCSANTHGPAHAYSHRSGRSQVGHRPYCATRTPYEALLPHGQSIAATGGSSLLTLQSAPGPAACHQACIASEI